MFSSVSPSAFCEAGTTTEVGETCRLAPWAATANIAAAIAAAEADRHDRMLELAESLSAVLSRAVPSLSEEQQEELGIYMARHREIFARAFKNQPEALTELGQGAAD